MSTCIAVIPARGGSKRIPKKNIKSFFGKPLIAYSIEVAIQSGLFDKVIVSTDDEEIKDVALAYGAEVPFIRPAALAGDYVATGEVIEHSVAELEVQGAKYDFVCTIYPTAPLLQARYLIQGFEQILSSDAVKVISATSMPFPIQRTFKITPQGRCEMFTPEHFMTRSQDLDQAFQDAGQFCWERRGVQASKGFGHDTIPLILPRHLVQDIDTLEDWKRVEYMYQVMQLSGEIDAPDTSNK